MGPVHAENPGIADRRAKDVSREVAQHGVVALAVVLAEGDPLPAPGRAMSETAAPRFPRPRQELRGDLAGKEVDRYEELSPSRFPVLAIGRDPTAGDQQMHMGVIGQPAVPGVEHREDAGPCPEEPFLGAEAPWRRRPRLASAGHRASSGRVGRRHATCWARSRRRGSSAGQELGLTPPEPPLSPAGMTFGARPVATAMVAPEGLIAVVAAVQPPSQLRRAAGGDVRKRLLL